MRISFTWLIVVVTTMFTARVKAQEMLPVKELQNHSQRQQFLENAFQYDQSLRHYQDSTLLASGFNSEANVQAVDSLHHAENRLSQLMDQYLRIYGYPEKDEYSEVACVAPCWILNHCNNLELKRKNFPVLYQAYKDENLARRRLIDFLETMYSQTYNKEFNSYNIEERRLAELIKTLNLKKLSSSKF